MQPVKGVMMEEQIPVQRVDTNAEVLARIVKAISRKYDCTMKIDFSNGKRITEFIGDEISKACIADEVTNIFKAKKEAKPES
jgi:hypothetical protein